MRDLQSHQELEAELTNLINKDLITDDYYFDVAEAIKFKRFSERLRLPESKSGTMIKLLDFQLKIAIEIVAIKRKSDGERRFREVFISISRKNAKSFLSALILLYLFMTDKEAGQQNIIVNNSIDQAAYVFQMIRDMIKENKTIMRYCRIVESRRKIERTNGSFIQVMSNDPDRLDSYNPFCVIVDETHLDKTQGESFSKLQQGMGQRDAPLIMSVTTASSGMDKHNLEKVKYDHAKDIGAGKIKDDAFYYAIFEADDDCDLNDKEQWILANPAIDLLPGGFRKSEELERAVENALRNPASEAGIRRYYLNQHVALSNERAINMEYWNKSASEKDLSFLKGKDAWIGLDLSISKDFTGLVLVIPHDEKFYIIPHLFKPDATLIPDGKIDNFPYNTYAQQGHIHATKGDFVNFRYVRQKINELSKEYNIREIAYDNRASGGIVSDLQNDGFILVDHPQGFWFSPTISDFYELLFDYRIKHSDNPVMNWMIQNTSAKENSAGNLMFVKSETKGKIDGVIAMLMGLTRAVANQNKNEYDPNAAVNNWLDAEY